jgi:alpha-glucosidase
MAGHTPWWREAVVYQVYPRSFADSDGDGVGDLEGIRARLDHLRRLGVDAVWLSPIYRSPMRDFGYDVADHTDVDPVFGDLAAFDRLLTDAHAAGIRVILDFVPNHTSDEHPWFREARSSRTNPRRDWYVWRDDTGGGPPNNWRAAFGGGAWTLEEATRAWYLHLFLPGQPDLDWSNPAVESAMHDVLRFWLDRGVDGFRADVVHCIGKDPQLPDAPDPSVHLSAVNDQPATHGLLRGIRRVLDAAGGDRMMVGEVNLRDTARIATYRGDGDELHLVFDFRSVDAGWDPAAWRSLVADAEAALPHPGGWPTWVLSNHDVTRHRTRLGTDARARAAAVLLLTLRGTPFLYQGEELGLEQGVIPEGRRRDPGGRDGCRCPIPWTRGAGHGWPEPAWLPPPPDAAAHSAEAQWEDPGSILHLYREVIAARRASPALRGGSLRLLEAPDGVLAYERRAGADVRRVLVNQGGGPVEDAVPPGWRVQVASDRGPAADGALGRDAALLLRPALPRRARSDAQALPPPSHGVPAVPVAPQLHVHAAVVAGPQVLRAEQVHQLHRVAPVAGGQRHPARGVRQVVDRDERVARPVGAVGEDVGLRAGQDGVRSVADLR